LNEEEEADGAVDVAVVIVGGVVVGDGKSGVRVKAALMVPLL